MVEAKNISEPPKTLPNVSEKKREVRESIKKPSEKTEKPWEKLEKVNQELQKKYKRYETTKSLLEKASKEDVNAPGKQDAVDRNNAESQLKIEKEAFKKLETEYQTEIERALTDAKTKFPAENHLKMEQQWLVKSARDLHYDKEPLDESRVAFLAEAFPDAWKQTLLDPKSAENNPEIKKMRDVILDRVSDGAASIDRGDFTTDKEYQDALRQNFEDITGIKLDPQKAQELFDANSQEPDSTSPESRLAWALWNTLGKQYDWDPATRSWDDMGGIPKNEEGNFSKGFPWTKEALDAAIGDIRRDVGVTESSNPSRIREYHAEAGLNAGPSTPWCMSFVQYMARRYLWYNGIRSASARDGLKMWNSIQTDEPGCIVVTRGSGPSWCHIGIWLGNGEYISWNSGNAVKIKKIPSGAQFRSLKPSGGGH